jgi:hypothetical protein
MGGKASSGGATAGSASGSPGRAGATASGGSPSTAGTNGAGGCTDPSIMCVDADTATACDPLTGEVQTANCAEEFALDGLISNGCTTDELGSGCTVDAFEDAECEAGMVPFAVCADLTQSDLIDVYVACFHDNLMQAHMAVSCYADYLDEEAMTVDCEAADAACLPEM